MSDKTTAVSTVPAAAQTALNPLKNEAGIEFPDTSARPFNVLTGYNLGNNTLLLNIPMQQFYELSAVANERGISERGLSEAGSPIAQRKLDVNNATKLAI